MEGDAKHSCGLLECQQGRLVFLPTFSLFLGLYIIPLDDGFDENTPKKSD